MLIRQNTPPKSPTTLTNEQVEAWMRANPDRVQRLDNTAYDHSVVKQIKVKDTERKQVKPLDNKTIQQALTKDQRKAQKVEISFGKKSKQPAKPTVAKPKNTECKVPKRPNRLSALAKRRLDWLNYLQFTGWPMTSREVRAMFGITNPRFTADRINQDGDYISISKEIYKNRKTLVFRAVKDEAGVKS
ncbi:hypothetical protein SAMN02745664_12411 [Moraxella cuniculi DSM 21768]|uniref:Uncharacterized protein n=1 Tax=Moraxella cuniculi DSM 21768 TaxID=1122245 RepID=A0A1N7G6I3_9GAMM|nr:hypothetical protein [Moraxella cuniculi]OOS04352.1 hypothetical protein B0189_08555 [Moraxella cuniculi]SIS08171.1 hypothetical protein SAMN02745664_12411 [Moraxella cuniculi DSM 21768]